MTDRPSLRSLAEYVGILHAYHDLDETERVTSPDTCVALLAAMGFDGSTETEAGRALEHLERTDQRALLPPVSVVRAGVDVDYRVRCSLPAPQAGPVEYHVELRLEDGATHTRTGHAAVVPDGVACLVSLPIDPPEGYHRVRVSLASSSRTLEAEQAYIVAPSACLSLSDRIGDAHAFGLWTNLYTLRSSQNWGVGDLSDLRRVIEAGARHGADFVGINPLNALRNLGDEISPYCPVSRLFRNPIYIDVEAVPEFRTSRTAQVAAEQSDFLDKLLGWRDGRHVAYEAIAAAKFSILRHCHEQFRRADEGSRSSRGQQYHAYVDRQGSALIDFATFAALQGWLVKTGQSEPDWHTWPAAYQSPNAPAVVSFRDANRREIGFHCYVQFELDRQLAQAASDAATGGMAIGLYQDLAIGSAAGGSDAWSNPNLFLDRVEVGAPPDPYSATGQTWGFPPVDPRRLRMSGYGYWIRLVQGMMAHSGMLRIDHVMGLFRQFWIPSGRSANEGAYVSYPVDDLLGILALESRRHGTVIVGEDLGIVPQEVRPAMEREGMLSSQVMMFERDHHGQFNPADAYAERSLATATIHDLPPLLGLWRGTDLDIRRDVGLLGCDTELDHAKAEREHMRQALVARLRTDGLLAEDEEPTPDAVCAATHEFLARTNASLVGISLDDLAGEIDPVNIPGLSASRYPCWSRRMRRSLENIFADENVRCVLDTIGKHRAAK